MDYVQSLLENKARIVKTLKYVFPLPEQQAIAGANGFYEHIEI